MSEPNNVGLAAAVAGGYVLGRTKKGRMAITAAALLLGRRLSPRDAVVGGVRRLPGVPAGGDDGEAGTDEGHGRSAIRRKAGALASRAANRRLTALTEALHARTLALGAAAGPQDDEEDEDSEDAAGSDDEPEEPQRTAKKAAAPKKRTPARKKAPSAPGAAAGRKTPAKKRPAKPAPPAKKTPAKKAAAKKAAAKKSAPAKKSAARPQRER